MTTQTTDPAAITLILDKIARLKTLAERPGTPEEAVAAIAAIQRLQLRHNLTEAQIATADRNDVQGIDVTAYDIGGNNGWRKNLMHVIAKYSFCAAVFDQSGRRVSIFGEQHNVQIAIGLYEYLVDAINRLADEGWLAPEPQLLGQTGQTTARRWKNAFRVGADATMRLRFKEQQRENVADTGTSALVLHNDAALRSAVMRHFPRTRNTSNGAGYSDAHGIAAGKRAAHGISLAAQIDS